MSAEMLLMLTMPIFSRNYYLFIIIPDAFCVGDIFVVTYFAEWEKNSIFAQILYSMTNTNTRML